jgi:hypothetical protein
MAETNLKTLIKETLKQGAFSDVEDLVDVSDGPDDEIHVVVITRKFDDLEPQERSDLIWDVLQKDLDARLWSRISLAVGASPEEVKAI